MTQTIRDVFDLPSRNEIAALGFVVRLEEQAAADRVKRLVGDYVITPTVAKALPDVFSKMRHTLERGEERGWLVHGSFGSGKSHFMSFLSLLLENDPVAWAKEHPAIRDALTPHRQAIVQANLLPVRLHMLGLSKADSTLGRAVYEAFSKALELRGKAPFVHMNLDGVIAEARHEGEIFGDAFWRKLAEAGIVGSREEFEEIARGSPEEQEALVRAYLDFKKRSPTDAGIETNWAKGLQRLTRHAKEQGFGGVVFFIDELLLWLSGMQGPEFKRALNDLNVMVDHNDGKRAVPLLVFAAVQRNIREFFPDMTRDDEMYDHLSHHEQRFEKITLADVELRHVCKDRVLRKRDPEAIRLAVDGLLASLDRAEDGLEGRLIKTVFPGTFGDDARRYLADVYPFHPALIDMLIDVSSLLQRERTALRLLYELLVIHYPDLQLGKLLPVSKAFDALFVGANFEGSRREADLQAIRALHSRFDQAMRELLGDGRGFDEERRKVADALLKTALLAEVSPRLKGTSALTVERLVRLNDAEVVGELDRARMARAFQDLVEVSRKVPALQVRGTGKEAEVSITLRGVNFEEILEQARGKVKDANSRLKAFLGVLMEQLGLEGDFKPGQPQGSIKVGWRGTDRKGSLQVANVRELPNSAFDVEPGDEFRIVVDYPWDDPGHGVEEDLQRVKAVQRREGRFFTVCWLPRHFDQNELSLLLDLAAADLLESGRVEEELLKHLSATDRKQVLDQARNMRRQVKNNLVEAMRRVYRDHAHVEAMVDVKPSLGDKEGLGGCLESLARTLLDRKFPEHPDFKIDVRTTDLQLLADWWVEAAEQRSGAVVPYSKEHAKVLDGLGGPNALELLKLGQTHAQLNQSGRYLQVVTAKAQDARVSWAAIDGALAEKGFQPNLRNFFLSLLARAYGYRVLFEVTGERFEPKIDGNPRTGLVLHRAEQLDVAEWGELRDLAPSLLGVPTPAPHRTVAEQDRLEAQLRAASTERSGVLVGLHELLVRLGAEGGSRIAEVREARACLAPLLVKREGSHETLRDFLTSWKQVSSPQSVGAAMKQAPAMKAALEKLATTTHGLLQLGRSHPQHGDEVQAHLKSLQELLESGTLVRTLDENAVRAWNGKAEAISQKLVKASVPVDPPPSPKAPEPAVVEPVNVALFTHKATFAPTNVAAVDDLLREFRSSLAAMEREAEVEVELVVRKRP